jgi:hypothetical protein
VQLQAYPSLVVQNEVQPQDNFQIQNNENGQLQNDPFDLGNIQVGFVETFVPPVQPVLAQANPSVAVVRC